MITIKTLIELFDKVQIENAVAGLRFMPQKIIFVGFKELMRKKKISDIQRFFCKKCPDTELEFQFVDRYDYTDIYDTLNQIIDQNEDCVFDLTGGKELVLAAIGEISAKRDIPMLQINVRTAKITKVKNCNDICQSERSYLSIADSIVLNGCLMASSVDKDFADKLNTTLKDDIERMWHLNQQNPAMWNRLSKLFALFEKYGSIDSEYRVAASIKELKDAGVDVLVDKAYISTLSDRGIITDFKMQGNIFSFKYKNRYIRQCILKSGNILEMYAYMLMQEIRREDQSFYDDIDMGVYIDWDGVIHDDSQKYRDTKNEIDLMLTRNLIPMFVSCKNGEVHKEALYELSVVAEKFGGRYARKILLASYISRDEQSRKYILQRAHDMGIVVIDNLFKLSRDEFKQELKRKIK